MKGSRHLRQELKGKLRRRLRRRIRDSVGGPGNSSREHAYVEPVVQQRRAWHTGLRLAEGSRFRCGAGPRPDAERGGRREAEAIQESLAVVAMAGDGPESVLKMLRSRLPQNLGRDRR